MDPQLQSLFRDLLIGPESELGARIRAALPAPSEEMAPGSPVLICGCGHSGTTLLLSVLSAHPHLQGVPFESNFGRRSPEVARDFMDLFGLLSRQSGRPRWVEKTPIHIHFLPQLLALCPKARVVLCLRDGRDVACSIRNRHGDLGMGIARWIKDNRAAEPLWSHPQVHLLRYEQLVEDFKGTIGGVLEFIDEDWDDALLRYHETAAEYYGGVARKSLAEVMRLMLESRPEKKAPGQQSGHNNYELRYWQVSQPVFDGRGIWREQMSERERKLFKAVAGEMLLRYGYVMDQDW